MTDMLPLYTRVALKYDIPERGLKAGSIGSIVDIHKKPCDAYEVEFCDEDGQTLELFALEPDKVVPVDE